MIQRERVYDDLRSILACVQDVTGPELNQITKYPHAHKYLADLRREGKVYNGPKRICNESRRRGHPILALTWRIVA